MIYLGLYSYDYSCLFSIRLLYWVIELLFHQDVEENDAVFGDGTGPSTPAEGPVLTSAVPPLPNVALSLSSILLGEDRGRIYFKF